MSGSGEHSIVLSPVGDVDGVIFKPIRREIHRIFGYRTRVIPLLDDVGFALDTSRHQYHSTPILNELARLAPSSALKVLGLTTVDLFIPILTYVYGEAQLAGRACILSTHRLQDGLPATGTQKAFLSRVVKEAIHELGHTFDLRHCRDHRCLMSYCRSEKDVDHKSGELCRYCRVLLEDAMKRQDRNPATSQPVFGSS